MSEAGKRANHLRVSTDEATIEVGEAEERSDAVDLFGDRPVAHRSHLLGVHANAIGANDEAEVLHLLAVELALSGFRWRPAADNFSST
jgi:hypothetical protein